MIRSLTRSNYTATALNLLLLAAVWAYPLANKLILQDQLIPLPGSSPLYLALRPHIPAIIPILLAPLLIIGCAAMLAHLLPALYPRIGRSSLPLLLGPLIALSPGYSHYDLLPPALAATILIAGWTTILPHYQSKKTEQDRWFRHGIITAIAAIIYPYAATLALIPLLAPNQEMEQPIQKKIIYLAGIAITFALSVALLYITNPTHQLALLPDAPIGFTNITAHLQASPWRIASLAISTLLYARAVSYEIRHPYSRKATARHAQLITRAHVVLILLTMTLRPYPSGITIFLGLALGISLAIHFMRFPTGMKQHAAFFIILAANAPAYFF